MSELAARAFSSRSGMTRRVARLVDEGLITRANDEADARGVIVARRKRASLASPTPPPSISGTSSSYSSLSSPTRSSPCSRARSTR